MSTINITACNLPPGSVVFDRSVNVVQCAPRFDPVLERLPLDGQPITMSMGQVRAMTGDTAKRRADPPNITIASFFGRIERALARR